MVRVLVWACLVLVCSVATAAESSAPRTLYLVRHGAYVPDRNADPKFGPGLTPLGVAQARGCIRLDDFGPAAARSRDCSGDARNADERAARTVSAH